MESVTNHNTSDRFIDISSSDDDIVAVLKAGEGETSLFRWRGENFPTVKFRLMLFIN